MSFAEDDKNLRFVPLEELQTPRSGEVVANSW
jgi:hypothetical protein